MAIYAALLTISVLVPELSHNSDHDNLFVDWQRFTAVDAIKLSSAIALSFFFPGYALVGIISSRKQTLGLLPKILVAYFLSMFIAGFTGYILSLVGFEISEIKLTLVAIYLIILLAFMQKRFSIFPDWRSLRLRKGYLHGHSYPSLETYKGKLVANLSLLVVFGSLVSLIVLSTSVLHDGVIIGDQWFHHGRAIQFVSGNYDIIDVLNADYVYPPLLPALLSSFFVMADVPTVNAYASIGFLNMMAVFAFYYFCKKWMPVNGRKSALLASVLFTLSSGFGWIHAVSMFVSDPITASEASMQAILSSSTQTYDIRSPSTFLLASHPDFSTGLQLIVLPVGFVLLGIIKQETANRANRYWYLLVISLGAVLGIFSHDEIYFFIIIASMLPPIFKLPDKNFIYVGLLIAIGVALFTNYVFSEEYLGSTVIIGIPLIVICFLFVFVAWVVYLTKALEKIYGYIISRPLALGKLSLFLDRRVKLTTGVVLVSMFSYLYAFTLLTWAEISREDIAIQTSESFPRNVPWYLYPIKLGLVGVLGTFYLLSYIFRKFEKELFVFGLIAVIAIVTGPYYDEHRFSKYVMVGLIGPASLLIYKMTLFLNNTKIRFVYPFSGLLVAIITVISSISTLMFISYDAWSLEESDSQPSWLNRRNFPSPVELDMFEFIRDTYPHDASASRGLATGIHIIITWPREYQTATGLLGKFQGFSGIPIPKMLETPLALNASSLESFYSLLAGSNTGLIVVPLKDLAERNDVFNKTGVGATEVEVGERVGMKSVHQSQDVVRFALANFQKIYQDNSSAILVVPKHIKPPSPKGDVAIISQATPEDPFLLSAISNSQNRNTKVILPYDNQFFNKISKSHFIKIMENKKDVMLNAYNKSQTLWSSEIKYGNGDLNYIESEFRVIDKNREKQHDECGLVWQNGEKKYYIRLRDDKLEFSETPAPKDRYIIENQQVKLNKWMSYTLKIIFLEDHLQVYVNDILRLRVPNNLYDSNYNISKTGIRCAGNTAEFGPVSIAHISKLDDRGFYDPHDNALEEEQTYQYYYLLTSLALSGAEYDTFLPNDYSVFSKENIVLPNRAIRDFSTSEFDNKDQLSRFLKYVRDGGTLTILNTDKKADGWLATSFFSIQHTNNTSGFNSIVKSSEPKYPLEVSGNISNIESVSPGVTVKSYYDNSGKRVSPFSMEKSYGKGKIVFIEAAGYFDAVSQFPERYFFTLSELPRLFGIPTRNLNSDGESRDVSFSNSYNIGNITIIGDVIINSSSLLLPMEEKGEDRLNSKYHIQDVSIVSNKAKINSSGNVLNTNSNNSAISPKDFGNKSIFHDVLIRNLEFYGQYKATIRASGSVDLPSPLYPLSQHDYFSISIPTNLDLTLMLLDKDAHANITLADGTKRIVKFTNNNDNKSNSSSIDGVTKIYFHNIKPALPRMNSTDFLMKRPEVSVQGNVTFESLFQGEIDFDLSKDIEGTPLELMEANVDMRLGYVDGYDKTQKNKRSTNYLTYFRTLQADQLSENSGNDIVLRAPGDISDVAKQKGILIPWKKVAASETNIVLVTAVSVASLLAIFLGWQKTKRRPSTG